MDTTSTKPISSVSTKGPFVFVYFDLPGQGEKVRLALTLAGLPFEDKRVSWPDWATLKPTMKYGQLPLLKVGDEELYQSNAMLKYVALASGKLYPPPSDLTAQVLCDEMLFLATDMLNAWVPPLYSAIRPNVLGHEFDDEDQQKELVKKMRTTFVEETMPKFMKFFTRELEMTQGFLAGKDPTIADCALVPLLHSFTKGQFDHVPSNCLEAYPVVAEYLERFLALPEVKAFYDEDK